MANTSAMKKKRRIRFFVDGRAGGMTPPVDGNSSLAKVTLRDSEPEDDDDDEEDDDEEDDKDVFDIAFVELRRRFLLPPRLRTP